MITIKGFVHEHQYLWTESLLALLKAHIVGRGMTRHLAPFSVFAFSAPSFL
jgi:hypothetical protein